jgi:hypothetical protein
MSHRALCLLVSFRRMCLTVRVYTEVEAEPLVLPSDEDVPPVEDAPTVEIPPVEDAPTVEIPPVEDVPPLDIPEDIPDADVSEDDINDIVDDLPVDSDEADEIVNGVIEDVATNASAPEGAVSTNVSAEEGPVPESADSADSKSLGVRTWLVVVLSVLGLAGLILLVVGMIFLCKCCARKRSKSDSLQFTNQLSNSV